MSTSLSGQVVLKAVAGNGILAVGKFAVWLMTPSPSMWAEAVHSLADTTNQILLYIGVRHGQSGPSPQFPWGTTNARYLWNLISAVGIFFIGFVATVGYGVYTLNHQTEYEGNIWHIVMLSVAMVVEGAVLYSAIKAVNQERGDQGLINYIRKGDNPTTVAVLLEDGIAILGVLLAFIGIGLSHYYQSVVPDAIASISIGSATWIFGHCAGYSQWATSYRGGCSCGRRGKNS